MVIPGGLSCRHKYLLEEPMNEAFPEGTRVKEQCEPSPRGKQHSSHTSAMSLCSPVLQQVKTVRFQNYSPPPAKHHTSGKPEQPATPKGSQPEAAPLGPEMTILFAHRSGCHSGQQTDLRRKSAFSKTVTPASTASATQTAFPSK